MTTPRFDANLHTSTIAVTAVIVRRELVRFRRQPARVAAAIITPCMLWLFIAGGFGDTFKPLGEEADYAAFLMPGMMTLVAVFASIFSSISVIEDRNEGWLQAVLVSPAPRSAIALGKTIGGAKVAFFQAVVLLAALPFVKINTTFGGVIVSVIALALTCMAMSAMGLAFAWRCRTSAAFHAVMNLVFMPMWLLSGAFFARDTASGWLKAIMTANPLTWCTEAIREPLVGDFTPLPLIITAAFAIAMFAITTMIVAMPSKKIV